MKKLGVFVANGTEEVEAITVVDYLRRAGVEVDLISINQGRKVLGAHNIYFGADKIIEEVEKSFYDGFYIPGGLPGATNIRDNKDVIEIIKAANKNNKIIAALCAGPIVLERAGILANKKYTCYPGFEKEIQAEKFEDKNILVDGNLITGKGPAFAAEISFSIIEALEGKDKAEEIRKDTLYSYL